MISRMNDWLIKANGELNFKFKKAKCIGNIDRYVRAHYSNENKKINVLMLPSHILEYAVGCGIYPDELKDRYEK